MFNFSFYCTIIPVDPKNIWLKLP